MEGNDPRPILDDEALAAVVQAAHDLDLDPEPAVQLVSLLASRGEVSVVTGASLSPEAAGRIGLARIAPGVPWPTGPEGAQDADQVEEGHDLDG